MSGVKLDVAFGDGADGVGGDGRSSTLLRMDGAPTAASWGFVDGEEPLHGEARLDDGAGALREGDGVLVVLDGDEQAGGFEVGDDLLAGGEAVEAVVGRAGRGRCARSRRG